MSLFHRVTRKLRLYRDRFVYEVWRPRLSKEDVVSRLDTEQGVDAADGFASMLQGHLSATPSAPAWEVGDAHDTDTLDKVNWHLEPHFGVSWPRRFEGSISDHHPGSDIVLLWHKNKMMFLLDLAEHYASSGEERHAQAWYRTVDSWCRQNPYLVGKNWRSPMEVGTRLAVWSFSLAALRDAPTPSESTCARIMGSVVCQADFLASHFSHKDLPNNHLIGEAATLYLFATYWTILRDSASWRSRAEEVLVHEVERQVLGDGFDYENSVNYHFYVIDFLLLYLHAKALRGETPPTVVTDAAARMIDTALALVSPSGRLPQIGDDSMTEFLALRPLGNWAMREAPACGTVRAAEIVRPGFAATIGKTPWGRDLIQRDVPLQNSRYFADAGVAAIRGTHSHATFVSGPQHDRPFSAGHLHLDSGSFELEVGGVPVFVDSGTYLYTYDAAARFHFKGASAHNTVMVDGREPVECGRVFGWDEIHTGRTVCFQHFDTGTLIGCERDVPGRDEARFLHRRHFVEIEGNGGLWAVVDTVAPIGEPTMGDHEASVLFHAALPASAVTVSGTRKLSLRLPGGASELYMDVHSTGTHEIELIDDPADMRCWYSRWYGDLCRGVTIRTSMGAAPSCCVLHVVRRPDVSVRLDDLSDGCVALTAMSDGPARSIVLDTRAGALTLDGQPVVPGSRGEQ